MADLRGISIAPETCMINPDKLTVKSGEAINDAVAIARRAGNPQVYDLHLLLALLAQDEGIVVPVLQKLGSSVASIREQAEREAARYPKQTDAQPNLSRELNQVFDRAEKDAKDLGDEFVSTEHLLLALSDVKGTDSRRILCNRCAAVIAFPIRIPRINIRPFSATLVISPMPRERESWIL
jgi:ATP-dependent Clp protease ATP-binding subunit ClpB